MVANGIVRAHHVVTLRRYKAPPGREEWFGSRRRISAPQFCVNQGSMKLKAASDFAIAPATEPSREPSPRACLKTGRGPVFAEKARWRGATKEHTRQGSVTEEQRSQRAFCAKTLRAADLLPLAGVGSAVTARCGDAPASPPWPPPKSLAAGPHPVFRQALRQSTSAAQAPLRDETG